MNAPDANVLANSINLSIPAGWTCPGGELVVCLTHNPYGPVARRNQSVSARGFPSSSAGGLSTSEAAAQSSGCETGNSRNCCACVLS